MPGDTAVNRPAACRPAALLLQRHAAFQGGLQASELLEDLDRALKDGALDPGKFLTIPASGSPGSDASAQPLITARARSISREVRATATTSTDRPSLWSACQSPRCAPPHERSAVEVSWPGST